MTYEEFLVDFRAFCVKYQAWVDGGAPSDSPFHHDCGLCDNYATYRETLYTAEDFYEQREYLMWMFVKIFPIWERRLL